jgi:dipeptidyl aminopeptidase/acylaminoacyl peptidase
VVERLAEADALRPDLSAVRLGADGERLRRAARGSLTALAVGIVSLVGASTASAAFPGTNGRIAHTHFVDGPGATGDIFAMDFTGGNRVPLTTGPTDDFDPSFSADGEKIAFSRIPPGGDGQIWVMNQDGSSPVGLTVGTPTAADFAPAFSPDGTKIAFTRFDGKETQVWIMNSDGSGQTALTATAGTFVGAQAPSFSPDGQRIAFSFLNSAGDHLIATIAPNGTGLTPLDATAGDVFSPDWSPDGTRIAFTRRTGATADIAVINANGTGLVPLTFGAGEDFSPAFSPDGTRVAFARDDAGFTRGDIDLADSIGTNGNVVNLTNNPADTFDDDPTVQPLNPPACDLTGEATSTSPKRVTVTVTCPAENATAVISGSGKAKVPDRRVAGKAATKEFEIPPVTAAIPAAAPTPVTVKVSKKGTKAIKRALEAGKKAKATISATMTDDLAQTSTETFKVKFKPKN